MECSLHYPGGVEVAIAGGWYAGDVPFAMEFDLQASGGELRYANDHLQLLRPPEPLAEIALPAVDPYANSLLFYRLLSQGRAPGECTPESSAQAVELARAILLWRKVPRRTTVTLKAK